MKALFTRKGAQKFKLDTKKKVKGLSTGYSSIFKIIVALSVNAPYTLYDEPILGLDANHRDLFYKVLLENYEQSPKTIVISTHLIEEVANIIEDIIIIKDRKVLKNEPCHQLLSSGYTISGSTTFIGIYVSDANNGNMGSIGGMKFSTAIFVFAIGLISFKDTFKMFLQNGLSRGTLFKSFILSIMTLSVFMSLIDSINTVIVNIISNYDPIYLQIYGRRYAEGVSEIVKFLDGFLWSTFTYLTVAMVGYFLAILYYRMDKKLTIIVSVGVPGFLFFILPIIEFNFTKGAIIRTIGKFISFASGFENGYNPYYYITTSIFVFIIFGGLSYGLVRKAVVKG